MNSWVKLRGLSLNRQHIPMCLLFNHCRHSRRHLAVIKSFCTQTEISKWCQCPMMEFHGSSLFSTDTQCANSKKPFEIDEVNRPRHIKDFRYLFECYYLQEAEILRSKYCLFPFHLFFHNISRATKHHPGHAFSRNRQYSAVPSIVCILLILLVWMQ